jgi:CRISPR-associated endonuclease Csn1
MQEIMGKNIKYNIGLDVGTNSVGWAVIDDNNDLVRFKRKNMWGVRLFETGETAVNTRLHRGQRRRYHRRRERIILLRQLLESMVLEVDETFFLRLDESFLDFKDRTNIEDKYGLFCDKDFNDKDFYNKYRTVYHLRNSLINCNEKIDPRFIYLALHNIIKYRGNFLYERQSFSNDGEIIEDTIYKIIVIMNEKLELKVPEEQEINNMQKVLVDKSLSKKEKQERLINILLLEKNSKKIIKEITNACMGYKADLAIIFNDESINTDDKRIKVEFSDPNYDDNESTIIDLLGDNYEFIELLKKVYSFMTLHEILLGSNYISEAMISKYDKHKKDLSILKRLVKKQYKQYYSNLFRKEKVNKKILKNYVNYIKNKCDKKDLYKTIKDILKTKELELSNNKDYIYCIEEMEKDNFLNRQKSRLNGVIPYQLHKKELEMIIDNQSKFYPELAKNRDRIIKILEFKIPYYVGPLNTNSPFAWVERKGNEKIYPWNFDEVVNIDVTAEKFITKMTNYCTYLPDKKVIPKNSLLYSKYEVLSELKQIKINGKFLDIKDINNIINDLFLRFKKVKEKQLIDWLVKEQYPDISINNLEITGYQKDKEFASSLKSYIDFNKIIGEINSSNYSMIEEIIYWITIFQDKKILRRKIKSTYNLDIKIINIIVSLNYSGWSRLSKELLIDIKTQWNDGSKKNIMEILEQTNKFFMQIIYNKDYSFKKIIEESQVSLDGDKIKYDNVKELHGSSSIKRGIWQTIKVVDEIIKIKGYAPKNIFIEFAREDQKSKRTNSRYKKLKNIYDNLDKDTEIYNKQIIKDLKVNEKQMDSDRVFLYFLQNGKCMYTGESLSLDKLSNYQVDHIIPQSFIKDDSLDNRVLVTQKANQEKLDKYPLDYKVRKKMRVMWMNLFKNGLISAKKYYNLTTQTINEGTQQRFINRQLVETRQISKHVANLFKSSYVNSNIITIKADLVSNFKQQYEIYKNRNVNDLHHAKDAYLVATLGNYVIRRFPKLEKEYIYGDFIKYKKSIEDRAKSTKQTSKEKNGFVIATMANDSFDPITGDIIWSKNKSISHIKKVMNYRDCIITKKLEIGTGQFFNINLVTGKDGLVSRKANLDAKKYGGYDGIKMAYFVAIEYTHKNKRKKKVVGIPINEAYLISNDNKLISYLKKAEYKDVKILCNKILKNQLIIEDGRLEYIASQNEIHNAKQLIMESIYEEVIAKANNGFYKTEDLKQDAHSKLDDLYEYLIHKYGKEYHLFSSVKDKLIQMEDEFKKMSFENKIEFINQILNVTRANSLTANLSNFTYNGKKLGGRIGRKNSYSIDLNKTIFIHQSVTGLFEKRYKL